MLKVKIEGGSQLRFLPASGSAFVATFQRTLRIPDDGKTYPLPPGLGAFPIRRVLDYRERVPAEWVKTSGIFIPMYQREALWISFRSRHWRPNAVKVAAGKINAVSGKPWNQQLSPADRSGESQDYMVCPPQLWLDGFKTGKDVIRQFTAMPLGMGYTVEAQVTGKEEHGGLQMIVYEPRPGRFPEQPPPPPEMDTAAVSVGDAMGPILKRASQPAATPARAGREMGLGAGGRMRQKIYPDPHGIDTWDESNFGRVFIHIVNSMMWREITGEDPPSTPITARSYTEAGYPWFALYDEDKADVAASKTLSQVKSIAEMDASHGFVGVDDDSAVDVPDAQIRSLPRDVVPDGEW